MVATIQLQKPLWDQFQNAARRRRRDPVKLLKQYIEECLEVWEDQRLDEELSRDARRSGLRESDAVAVVRRYRQEKRK